MSAGTSSSTVTFNGTNSPATFNLCIDGSYFLNPSTTNGTFSSSNVNVATVNSSGYVTGVSTGSAIISLVTTGGTVSANINVTSSASPFLTISDPSAQSAYKFNNNPQGPVGGTINYVGYNGKVYSSQSRPNKTGFYRASLQSANDSGCPYQFYIFRCTTCSN